MEESGSRQFWALLEVPKNWKGATVITVLSRMPRYYRSRYRYYQRNDTYTYKRYYKIFHDSMNNEIIIISSVISGPLPVIYEDQEEV